jgi:hypothetical protein
MWLVADVDRIVPSCSTCSDAEDKMAPDRIERLRETVSAFRKAIVDSLPELSSLVDFQRFPAGACGDASDMLGRLLNERGEGPFEYVAGPQGGQTHAWLEGHGLIVDITASQFPYVSDPAIVTTDNSWHSQFVVNDRRKPGFDGCVPEHQANLESAYRLILAKFDDQRS